MTDNPQTRNVLSTLVLVLAAFLALSWASGCVEQGGGGDVAEVVAEPGDASRQYLLDLADTSDAIAAEIDAGTITVSGQAYQKFHDDSDAAKAALNKSLGGYQDRNNPPADAPRSQPWRDMATQIRGAVR